MVKVRGNRPLAAPPTEANAGKDAKRPTGRASGSSSYNDAPKARGSSDAGANLKASAKRFADGTKKLPTFVIQAETGQVWDLKSEEGVFEAIDAVLMQDDERYPGETLKEKAGHLSTAPKKMGHLYRFGDEVARFAKLFGRIRSARGIGAGDTATLSNKQIILEIMARHGSERPRKPIAFDIMRPDGGDWDLKSEDGIVEAVEAVVRQDRELYPEEDLQVAITRLSMNKIYTSKRYRFGSTVITVQGLLARMHALRKEAADVRVPTRGMLLKEIKISLGWREPVSRTMTIHAGNVGWDLRSEEGILRAIRAVLKKDTKQFPGRGVAESAAALNTETAGKVYRFSGEELSIKALLGRLRVARDLRYDDRETVSDAELIDEIKRTLGWRSDAIDVARADGKDWDLKSEDGLYGAIAYAIEADDEFYPGTTLAERLNHLTTDKKCARRRYRIGHIEMSMSGLWERIRTARGLWCRDRNALPDVSILYELKRRVGALEAFKLQDPRGTSWDFTTEDGIYAVLREVVLQDKLYYQGDTLGVAVGSMKPNKVYMDRDYQFDEMRMTLGEIIQKLREARGLNSTDIFKLSNKRAVAEIKKALGWKHARKPYFVIRSSDDVTWDLKAERGIFAALEAIIAQDKRYYPKGDIAVAAGSMTTNNVLFGASYRFGRTTRTLATLINRLRVVWGMKSGDSARLSDLEVVEVIRAYFGWTGARQYRYDIDADLDLASEAGIMKAARAIVAQDAKLYPGDDPSEAVGALRADVLHMGRIYRFGDREISLNELLERLRLLRGFAANDERDLTRERFVTEVKERLGWKPEMLTGFLIKPRAIRSDDPGWEIVRAGSEIWDLTSEAGIFKAVQAIVEQDKELYPGDELAEAVSVLSTDSRYLRKKYCFGGKTITLLTLLHRISRLRNADTKANGGQGTRPLIEEIKKRFGCADDEPEAFAIMGFSGRTLDLRDEGDIMEVIRAIVDQDKDLYPGTDSASAVGVMSVTPRFMEKDYLVGGEVVRLMHLINRIRSARGHAYADTSALPGSEIVRDIKHRLGWVEPEPDVLEIKSMDGEPWDLRNEEGILRAIGAIVLQDKAFYPPGELQEIVGVLSSSPKFLNERYRLGETVISLRSLFGRIRAARGHRTDAKDVLPDKALVDEVKLTLGWIPPEDISFPIELPAGVAWDTASEDGILAIVRAIITQDQELYLGDSLSAIVGGMRTQDAYLYKQYRCGDENISLGRLIEYLRKDLEDRGVPGDFTLRSSVLRYMKRKLGGMRYADRAEIEAFATSRGLNPVIAVLMDAPGHLRDYLEVFYGDELGDGGADNAVRTFSDLKLYSEIAPPASPIQSLEALIEVMRVRRERMEHLSDAAYASVQRIIRHAVGRFFEEDARAAERAIKKLARINADPKIRQLLRDLVTYYRAGTAFDAAGVKTELFLYQRLGAQFLSSRSNAILADEPGMGKTLTALAAAEKLRQDGCVRKVLIITPAGVKGTWREEIDKHLVPRDGRKVVTIEGKVDEKRDAVRDALDADYAITNYAFLRDKSEEDLAPLLANVDLVIVDEAQKMSNPSEEIQQAEAVRSIQAPRRWLVTATPYYSRPEYIYSLLAYLGRDRYGGFGVFRKAFTNDIDGLRMLRGELEGVMLRRRLAEALGEYRAGVPLETQGVRLPRKDVIPPAVEGSYELSEAQVELLRELSQDVRGWMQRHGYAKKMTAFAHLHLLYGATIDPALVGDDLDAPLYDALDEIVERRLAEGKKILIYGHHRKVVARLRKRYADCGAVQFNSAVSLTRRMENLAAFETDPAVRIMVAGVHSGGVGLNIKAADTVIYTERSFDHSAKIQSEGRPQRLSPERPKESYEVITMVGRYPEEIVAQESDPVFKAFMEQGTVAEIFEERLGDLDRIHRLVMDGFMTDDEARRNVVTTMVHGFSGLGIEGAIPAATSAAAASMSSTLLMSGMMKPL